MLRPFMLSGKHSHSRPLGWKTNSTSRTTCGPGLLFQRYDPYQIGSSGLLMLAGG